MNRPSRTELKGAFLRVREVLARDWNPVGAEGLPADEYDSYVWPLVALLQQRASRDAVTDCLRRIESKWFSREPSVSELAPVVDGLMALKIAILEEKA